MSQWRGQIEDIDEPSDLVPLIERYYHVPTLIALLAFMLWSRVRDWKNFVVDDTVFFSGNDPWYHYRMVSYTVRNWPQTSPFDPWTYFPFGTHSSQFGTIFDQLMATAALLVGLGNPSDQTVKMVVLFTPAVLGTLTAIPVYFIGKRAAGRFAGIAAVGVLALFGSTFVARGTVGFADHHIAEVFFMTVAILATMIAVSVAEEEKPVWELLQARDVASVRRPVGWAALAGVATALYIWTWPPGVFLVGILGVYYLVEMSSLQAHGESPEPIAIVGAVSLTTTAVLSLAAIETTDLSATSFNLVQPGLALAVAAGCVFMAWLAREWDDRSLEDYQYPIAVVGIIAVLAGLMAVVIPNTFDFIVKQTQRVVGLSVTNTAATIGEAQPLPFRSLRGQYGLSHFVALLGVIFVGARQFWRKPRAELLLIALWTVFMLLATLTQRRFDYYLGVTVAVMAGYTIATVADYGNLFDSPDDIETYQIVSIVAIVLVVFAPLVFTQGGVLALQSSAAGPGPSTQAWNNSMGWMQDNTPREGNLGGAGNEMDFYGTYEATEDFDYEPGFYGVLSWWDYGHWITTMGERIPTANPFQQGADQAANFLLSGTEEQANGVLNELEDGEGTETRYVAVDWKMATAERVFRGGSGQQVNINGKYFAPFQFYSAGEIQPSDYYKPLIYRAGQGQQSTLRTFMRQKQPYYNSTVIRLYKYHGSAVEPEPIVLDWEQQSVGGQTLPMSQGVKQFDTMEEARNFSRNDGATSQIGGVGRYPEERVPAMENYRLVGTSDQSALQSQRYTRFGLRKVARGGFQQPLFTQTGVNGRVYNHIHATDPNWVKLFERVPGATIEGEGPANTTIQAQVTMSVPASNGTFTYKQQARTGPDGEFEMTVPYSTTGYDEWGTEDGYTTPEVQAVTPYQFRTPFQANSSGYTFSYAGTANVTEGQVIGEDESSTTVSLERRVVASPGESNETAANKTDAPTDETAGDESGNETTSDDTDQTSDDTNQSSDDTNQSSNETATATPEGDASSSADTPVGGDADSGLVGALLAAPLLGLVVLGRRR